MFRLNLSDAICLVYGRHIAVVNCWMRRLSNMLDFETDHICIHELIYVFTGMQFNVEQNFWKPGHNGIK